MPKKVLLTGAAGGVGIHVLTHIMHNTDWEVFVLDSFRHKGFHARFEQVFGTNPEWLPRVTIRQHDLTCAFPESLKEEMGEINIILHLAATSDVGFSIDNPVYTVKNNVDSTLTMLEYARSLPDLEVFNYFSTDEVYGPVAKGESHNEWEPHRPSNAYSASKAASEDLCYTWWRAYGVPVVITNTMNNFGEMQSASKFPVIVQKALQKGEKVKIHGNEKEIGTRFYIHSRNAADALLFIVQNLPAHLHRKGELDEPDRYHIVGDTHYSNLELAQTIARLMGKKLDYEVVDFHKNNPAHDIHYGLKDNKLRAKGWKQPVSTENGLAHTIKWQQEHPEWIQ